MKVSTFLLLVCSASAIKFVDNMDEVDQVMADLQYHSVASKDASMTPENVEMLQQLNQQAKDSIVKVSDSLMLQTGDPYDDEVNLSESATKALKLSDEIERVYNFERDVTTARTLDKNFDKTASKISEFMSNVRRTYKDPEYLRTPLADPYKAAERFKDDKNRREFESYKQALDNMKTKYQIKQSEEVAKNALASK